MTALSRDLCYVLGCPTFENTVNGNTPKLPLSAIVRLERLKFNSRLATPFAGFRLQDRLKHIPSIASLLFFMVAFLLLHLVSLPINSGKSFDLLCRVPISIAIFSYAYLEF